MNVVDALLRPAHGPRTALVTLQASHTHAELGAAVEALAAHLIARGARPGDFVAIVAENSFFSLACWLGAMRAGCVAVPLQAPSPETWRSVVEATRLRFACLEVKGAPARLEALPADACLVTDTALDDARAAPFSTALTARPVAWPSLEDGSLAMLLFTSGSTGRPRGVMLTHRNLLANARGIVESVGIVPDDRVMVVLPFQYSFGVSLVTTHLSRGACLVIDSRFMFPDKVLERLRETQCTGFAGVPSHYQSLLRRSRLKSMHFPSLRWVQQAGGHLAPGLVDELRAALPGVRVFVMYGATENTARISCTPPERLDEKRGTAGLPIPGVKVEIVDEAGAVLPIGEVGRVAVSGESASPGYFGEPTATAETFRGGRLYTGDLGRLDEDGFLFIVDRVGDFLKCGGTRTSVKVVEDALLHCPDVVEVAVLPVPDAMLGEAVAVLVVPRPGAVDVPAQVRAVAKDKLPLPLQPRELRLVESIPKSAAGKVQRAALRALFANTRP